MSALPVLQRFRDWLRARWPWALTLAVVALGAGGYLVFRSYQAARQSEQALAALRTEVIGRGDIVSVVSATGSILPEQQIALVFRLPGTLREVLVETGQTVKAGQVLARLDDTVWRLAVRQAEDALAVAEINRQKLLAGPTAGDIAVARANLRSANTSLSDLLAGTGREDIAIAKLNYDDVYANYQQAADQYNGLVQFGKDHPQFAASQDTLDDLKAGMESTFYAAEVARLQLQQLQNGADEGSLSVAYARVAQARAVLDQLQAPPPDVQIQRADLAVAQAQTAVAQAKRRAALAELTAPFEGVVAVVNVKTGEPAMGGAPAVILLDISRFHLDVMVDEVDVAQLSAGQAVAVTLDALPGAPVTGQVDRLAPTATTAGGIVSYAVRLGLDPTAAPLRTGMSATANIAVAEVHNVLLVPNWAIRRDRRTGQAYASLKVGSELKEVSIETGLRGETYTEVKSGVQAGDVAAVSTTRETLDLFGGGQ